MQFSDVHIVLTKIVRKVIEKEINPFCENGASIKGCYANVVIMARKPKYVPVLSEQVAAQVVGYYFYHLLDRSVERFCVLGFNAYNFLTTDTLSGGVAASIRIDSQAKAFAQTL